MFIVCGEALFDVFATGDTPTGCALDARIGGSPFNVALGLSRLAQPVSFLGGVSTGFLGDRLMRALADEGIGTGCVELLAAPTTLSLIGLDAHGVPSYSFYGEGAADRRLSLAALTRIPAQANAFHFGSYAMVVAPTADSQRALVEREHGRSLIAYDPNIRLNVEPNLARWHETLDWMLTRTHVLKVSDEDLHLLFPGADFETLARGWLARGVGLVVITRGGDGAIGFSSQASVAVPGVAVKVVDTVGAGDTFQASMLCWLAETGRLSAAGASGLDEQAMRSALTFAAHAAAITCSRRGADLPRRSELGPV
jgi:fructokinase